MQGPGAAGREGERKGGSAAHLRLSGHVNMSASVSETLVHSGATDN